jgi:Cof subfamily protein (haloacid dehalogenase superfamily)
MIKLVVSDLDGTLLNHGKSISPENRQAILEAQERGIRMVLATGRGLDSTLAYAKQLQMDRYGGYLVLNNGQQFYDMSTDKLRTNGVISARDARKAYKVALEFGLQLVISSQHGLMFYTPKALLPARAFYRILNAMLPYFGFIFKRFSFTNIFGFLRAHHLHMIKSEEDIVGEFQKIGFAHISSKLLKSEPELRQRLGQDFELFRVGDLWLDAAPKGISKLTGIQQVMALHQIDPHEVMTVGDSHNDYTMIHAFPLGIAMGNADPEIKEIAAEVTLTNTQHGVAAIIRKHILTQA